MSHVPFRAVAAWRWNELGVILVLLAAICASVGYYSVWTLLLFAAGATLAIGARRSAPEQFPPDP